MPPEIITICPRCGSRPGDPCADPDDGSPPTSASICRVDGGRARAFVALDDLPESVVEDLRKANLQANTVDSTAEDLGEAAPGIKDDADEQAKALMQDALDNPITGPPGEAQSPDDALGGAGGPDDVPDSHVGE